MPMSVSQATGAVFFAFNSPLTFAISAAFLQCPSAVPLCRALLQYSSALPLRNAFSIMQRLESEKQDALCQAEQQQQEYTLQMQCLQQACQDTLQRERAQTDERVHLYCLHHMHAQHVPVVRANLLLSLQKIRSVRRVWLV